MLACPKCGATPTPTACPTCGLAVDKMEAFARKLDTELPPPAVVAAWEALQQAWDDDARHAAFISIVVDATAFAWAAARYREKKPDPRAEQMLTRVRRAAEARLAASATAPPPPKTIFASVKLLIGGALAMVIALLLILHYIRARQEGGHEPPRLPAPTQQVR